MVTTEKDAVKLSDMGEGNFPIMSLGISLKITEGDHFKQALLDLLGNPTKECS